MVNVFATLPSHYLNNRTENSHQPTRQRERRMQGFKSAGHAQRFFAAAHGTNSISLGRHSLVKKGSSGL
jgi:putative transposase